MENIRYMDPLERLIFYWGKIGNTNMDSDNSSNIDNLSESSGIPKKIIRKDLRFINASFPSFLDSEEEIDYADDFSAGEFDSVQLSSHELVDDEEYSATEKIQIPVTIDEYVAFKNLIESSHSIRTSHSDPSFITSTIHNKQYVNICKLESLRNLEELENDIIDGFYCSFSYMTPDGSIENVTVRPLKIALDATENRYVLVATIKDVIKVFELDLIKGDVLTEKKFDESNSPLPLKKADKVWGFEFGECIDENGDFRKPLHVKVEFYDHGNVINKAKRALTYRSPISLTESTRNGNKILTYEDEVYGKDSFIRWILSFGSSVKVIKPRSVINEIIEICKREI